jgi:hypothetical protein
MTLKPGPYTVDSEMPAPRRFTIIAQWLALAPELSAPHGLWPHARAPWRPCWGNGARRATLAR